LSRIVATGRVFPPAEEILGEIVVAGEGELQRLLADAEALIVRGGSLITAELIEAAPLLRVIGRSGVGFSEIDLEAASRRGIPVVITPEAGAQAVAEGALTLMLALAKRLPELDLAVREGRWSFRDEVDLRDLEGSTLGIVGYGRIGRRLARLAEAFDMRVVAHDPYVPQADLGLPELFEAGDFVSLHVPLTPETRGLVGPDLLARAGGAILVNLGRGALVSSLDDLLTALKAGSLGGVGLDVFDPEPPDPTHPLFRHPRVVVSPHALGMTRLAKRRIYEEMSLGIAAVLRGERAGAVANPEVYG
jgi:D-3-phosphoglycerate dehydrogenase / 2-oxoglutarate reductase